ncbi:hypothetical protein EJ08DRAFT_77057 [Tothia fuscella]|uniref:Citrate transporter-like domain-containing protein n=1 Tax=Tothia fuscella TaxID=1048955 RepID=A0A9P4NXC7_9PEZI|nr:hypothetical protein EJ08DRAFT_77057 [Tothia fuscella]
MANDDTDTSQINSWRSIITLIIFVLTNVIVLFPFHIPIFIPTPVWDAFVDGLVRLRVIAPRQHTINETKGMTTPFRRLNFPLNLVTTPLIADLFLLAILAIGREEVRAGTLGANNISPIDIMVFFISLAYIAISIDASGLIRFLAFKVLQWGGDVGHRLFFYLYCFFFGLTSFIGNDPVILSGTAFLSYMTRVSSNIVHPRAWIYSQFATANIGSAILVSSNPTNLVLAGAFKIKFINYTANMIVPVLATAIVLFPFLLYIIFADESLIPVSIKMHELDPDLRAKKPVNPNIPHARGKAEEEENANNATHDEQGQQLSLEEIMNPFLDKGGAVFGAAIMAATLITLLALNAASQNGHPNPVFWVTLPAAVVMFSWDVMFGWIHRHETRKIAREGREEVEYARAQREDEEEQYALEQENRVRSQGQLVDNTAKDSAPDAKEKHPPALTVSEHNGIDGRLSRPLAGDDKPQIGRPSSSESTYVPGDHAAIASSEDNDEKRDDAETKRRIERKLALLRKRGPRTLASLATDWFVWSQETFPTAAAVATHLPYALVPFAFSMFVLVQALVTKGWVPVFAHGWDHWVNKTGTVGAIGGMGFISVILCNFAGTNIGTSILLSRVVQAWQEIHHDNGLPISDRTFWATVYSMAIGLNYGAFSAAFSASLAGLLWRDILARKHIKVHSLDFARVNLPIIAISMTVGCAVLVGQIYVIRSKDPYNAS